MKEKRKTTNEAIISFLKKQDDISKFGPYVKICYNAMLHLKQHKDFTASDKRLYERNYIISLAYMMGKYDGKDAKMSGLIVGGDINKFVFDNCLKIAEKDDEIIKETKSQLNFLTEYVSPDFVIHKNNKIMEIKDKCQKVVIEAKTTDCLEEGDFYNDFFKLNVYISRLKFRYGIYLLINTPIDKINSFIDRYINRQFYISKKCKNRMLFLIQESESDNPSLFAFKVDPKTHRSNRKRD